VNRRGTQDAIDADTCGTTTTGCTRQNFKNSFELGLAWQPKKCGTLIPSISAGWGLTAYSDSNTLAPSVNSNGATSGISNQLAAANIAATQSWTLSLQWKDAFIKGNTGGMSVGQPSFVTALRNGQTPQDGNYAWEWWYTYKVSDNISVSPLLFYLSNPSSAGSSQGVYNANTNAYAVNTAANVFGGLLTAKFKF